MQASLFVDDEVQTEGSKAEAVAPIEQPGIGELFTDMFKRYCSLLDKYAADLELLSASELEFPCVTSSTAISTLHESQIKDFKLATARSIRGRLVFHASRVFAPHGAPLEINTRELEEAIPLDRETLALFDACRIWEFLERKYGAGGGVDEAWRQTAQKIINGFWLKKGENVKQKGNYLALDLRVYIDSTDKKFDKKNRLSYNSRDSAYKLLRDLSCFARWAGRGQLAADLESLSEKYRGYSFSDLLESHKQYVCGEKGECVMVTFTTRFEFRFRLDVGEQLQQFLGTYGVFKE